MNNYIIMHKDDRVASIRSDGSCTIYKSSFVPYNLYLEKTADNLDARLNNLNNFYYWCSSRILTMDRKYAKEILNSLGKKQAVTDRDRAEIAISYHALSLTDVYWVKQQYEKVSFKDINLFEHSLSDSFVDVSLQGKSLTIQNAELVDQLDAAGDIATQGVAPKAWIRRNNTFYLLKDGEKRDVESELLASRIMDCFKVDHVRYSREKYQNIEVSSSKIITSLSRSIVAIEFVQIYALNHDLDFHKMITAMDPDAYYSMNIIDYLVGNTDRHWGNWGVWVDNDTNKIIGLHPLMDFNKAFTSYDTVEGAVCQTTPARLSQKEAAIEAVKMTGLNQIAEVKREWFSDEEDWIMFNKRLEILREKNK
ncbi:MAG: hypothetical protein K5637_08255 [Lachnospiraceae bacterium]|nr:hypothetical protein [Lachnospiraceae bacterium]